MTSNEVTQTFLPALWVSVMGHPSAALHIWSCSLMETYNHFQGKSVIENRSAWVEGQQDCLPIVLRLFYFILFYLSYRWGTRMILLEQPEVKRTNVHLGQPAHVISTETGRSSVPC